MCSNLPLIQTGPCSPVLLRSAEINLLKVCEEVGCLDLAGSMDLPAASLGWEPEFHSTPHQGVFDRADWHRRGGALGHLPSSENPAFAAEDPTLDPLAAISTAAQTRAVPHHSSSFFRATPTPTNGDGSGGER